ncbi:hypothetical protein [Thermococcus sp. AM4]|uniref:hypothetical protein n=1 Tax=Thermococcus sp. (strain AM4) TaxID=246969 RepID=UPI0001870C1C|nr:hypothetical protein [Thermococcus sp. AM4]
MRRLMALLISAVLVLSIVPFGFGSVSATSTTDEQSLTNSTANSTAEQVLAQRIVAIVERLHNMTSALENVSLPENASVMERYQLAEEYRERMEEAYRNGNYSEAVTEGILAMHQYRVVLQSMEQFREQVRVSVERMEEYFRDAEKLIATCDRAGINTTLAWRLLNETRKAYGLVIEDLREGNFTKAREDLKTANELKAKLDGELERLRGSLAYANAERIVNAFLERGQKAITFMENVLARVNETATNATVLQERVTSFEELYNRVKEMSEAGNYTGAMALLLEEKEIVKEFQVTVEHVLKKTKEKKIKEKLEDLKTFEREIQERLKEATKALEKLKRKGINTREAELKLKAAAQEFRAGFELAKKGDPSAKVHIELGLKLLHEVEEFIAANS